MFESRLSALVAREREVYDPLRDRMRPWIDVAKLRKEYKGGGGCALM